MPEIPASALRYPLPTPVLRASETRQPTNPPHTAMDSTLLELADRNRREALSILETLQIEAIWHSVGATPHLVGSLRSGLLMKHLDIDLHIYSPAPLHIGDSFAALSRIARNSGIRKIEYANLLDAEDNCLEWAIFVQR